jgi:glycogen synthase
VKVLMTADAGGGVWTHALTLADALAPHGVEVVLATMGRVPDVRQRRAAARHANVTLATSPFKLAWMEQSWSDVHAAGEWLLELEALVEPDVVHLNGDAHAALAWASPRVLVVHTCVLSWWRAVLGAEAPASWNRYRTVLREGVRTADLVIAPSRSILGDLERDCGPLPMARVIPNGNDAHHFWATSKEPFVLSAGRLCDDAKNVAALDRAAARVPWPVYVVGDRRHPDGTTRVYTHAHVLEAMAPEVLGAWMASAAIYAQPARYDPFGLSILEAALSGCALVLGDIPSLREHWDDVALFVSPHSDDELATVLTDLIRYPAHRRRLARDARDRARAQFGLARCGEAYLNAYRDVAHLTLAPALREEAIMVG